MGSPEWLKMLTAVWREATQSTVWVGLTPVHTRLSLGKAHLQKGLRSSLGADVQGHRDGDEAAGRLGKPLPSG